MNLPSMMSISRIRGLVTYDAKDPATSFAPTEDWSSEGAPNVLVSACDVGCGSRPSVGPATPRWPREARRWGTEVNRLHTTATLRPNAPSVSPLGVFFFFSFFFFFFFLSFLGCFFFLFFGGFSFGLGVLWRFGGFGCVVGLWDLFFLFFGFGVSMCFFFCLLRGGFFVSPWGRFGVVSGRFFVGGPQSPTLSEWVHHRARKGGAGYNGIRLDHCCASCPRSSKLNGLVDLGSTVREVP